MPYGCFLTPGGLSTAGSNGNGVPLRGYNSWGDWGVLGAFSLKLIAWTHMAGAFAILIFLIGHVYMTTTGHTPLAHIRAMITGWENVEEGVRVEAWEKAQKK